MYTLQRISHKLHYVYHFPSGEEVSWRMNDENAFINLQKEYGFPSAEPIHSIYIKKVTESVTHYIINIIVNDVGMTLSLERTASDSFTFMDLLPTCLHSFYFYTKDHRGEWVPSTFNRVKKEPEYYYFIKKCFPFFEKLSGISQQEHFEAYIPPHLFMVMIDMYTPDKTKTLEEIIYDIQPSSAYVDEGVIFF